MRALRSAFPFSARDLREEAPLASAPHALSQTTGDRDNAAHRLGHTTRPVGVGEARSHDSAAAGSVSTRAARTVVARSGGGRGRPRAARRPSIERLRFGRREELVLAALDIAVPPSCFAGSIAARTEPHRAADPRARQMLEQVATVVQPHAGPSCTARTGRPEAHPATNCPP